MLASGRLNDQPSEVIGCDTFPRALRTLAATHGARTAVSLRGDGVRQELSFAELDARSATLARGLLARGIGKGTRIGFIYGNGPEFAVTLAAIARIGAVAIPLSTLLRAAELVRVLRRSDVAGLMVQRKLLGRDQAASVASALPGLTAADTGPLQIPNVPYLRWILSDGPALPPPIGDVASLIDAATLVGEAMLRAVEAEVHPTDQALEIYTSGSTALPKGVKHGHGPLFFRARYLADHLVLDDAGDVHAAMPMFWVGGLMMGLMPALVAGRTTVCTERTVTDSRIAMGSVVSDDDMARLPKNGTHWALGMTETLGPYSFGREFRVPERPVCAPLDFVADGYEVRVLAGDRPAGEGEIGEVQVRGYPVTAGLHKEERERFFTPDGFYRTGDLGQVENGRIHFVGRSGDMIKTNGSNVSPAEVEQELQQLEGVHSAYVAGLPDEQRGQLLVAAIVPREGVVINAVALEAELRTRLSSFKVPRAFVVITREDVPVLHSNKVSRREMSRLLASRLGRGDRSEMQS